MKILKNISNYENEEDYLAIFNSALLVQLHVVYYVLHSYIKRNYQKEYFKKLGILTIFLDVSLLMLVIVAARSIYTYFFNEYHISLFLVIVCLVQITLDVFVHYFTYYIPKGFNGIIDIMKYHNKELGLFKIIYQNIIIIVITLLLACNFATLSLNLNIICMLINLYLIPYIFV